MQGSQGKILKRKLLFQTNSSSFQPAEGATLKKISLFSASNFVLKAVFTLMLFLQRGVNRYIRNSKDMRMVDPERVIDEVAADVLLQHLVVRDTQQSNVLLIYAFVPDVVQNSHLLKVGARAEVRPGWRGDGGQAVQEQLLPASPPCPSNRLRNYRLLLFIRDETVCGR